MSKSRSHISQFLSLLFVFLSVPAAAQQIVENPTGPWKAIVVDYDGQGDRYFDPPGQKVVSYRDDEFHVRLQLNGGTYSIISQIDAGEARRITLPREILQVNKIRRIIGRRFVVFGMVSSSAWEVCIVDPKTGTFRDIVAAYSPTISPDAKYLVYIKFFPTHASYPVEHHYMIYDLARSAEENRPTGVRLQNRMTVGTTVYPSKIGNREGDNAMEQSSLAHIIASDDFFWREDSRAFVFADRHDGLLSLVLVEIGGTGSTPITKTVPVPIKEVCEAAHKPGCAIYLQKVRFSDSPSPGIITTWRGLDITFHREFEFKLGEFKTAPSDSAR